MRIARGNTRFVLLTKKYAIKFARFKPLQTLFGLIKVILQPSSLSAMYARKGYAIPPNFWGHVYLFLRALAPGLYANRQEQELFLKHPELPLAPVVRLHALGLILVMERGDPVTPSEAKLLKGKYTHLDLDDERHVFRFGDTLKFVDYGHPTVPGVLTAPL